MTIRQETNEDFDEVYFVVKTAFASAQHSDGTEQDLVVSLRNSDAFVPELSLVAVADDGEIVGHIMFTKNKIGTTQQLTLAPLAVLPEYQHMGVGTALITEGHRIAKSMGYEFSVVIGSEVYYPKFGYQQAKNLGITFSGEIADENFMAINLQGKANQCCGRLIYPKEFGI